MASTSHSTSQESASTSGRSYDVFINHRGPDVKHTLAAKIYKMLTSGMGLRAFLDDKEFELGDNLPTELHAAIQSSSLHIAIFSENYAQSRWCLDELSLMRRTGAKIVPIFYRVKPEDVRYAKGTYAAAFEQHEEKRRHTPEKIQEWKDALFNVSNNIGHIVNNEGDENMLLKNITYCVMTEFKKLPLVVAEHAVGLDEIVEDFQLTALQSDGSCHNKQIVGIWGMGGSGKTTLAKKLYNDRYPSMERASLILDVRDAANKNLLIEKQKKLLQDLGFKSLSFDNIEEGKAILASKLKYIQALIILDDVDHVDQLNALLPGQGSESFIGSGSLIIVTTREFDVLRHWNISSYKMKPLSAVHAKQLFCWHAFIQPFPLDGFEELVGNFLEACCGLPLSLKVLGGQLYGNLSIESWKSLLDKISKFVDKDIKDRLRISYDALDDIEKDAFLDIACFFIGEQTVLAIEVWNGLISGGLYILEKLRNKCLVDIDRENIIRMHDHLRDLGKEIANRKSPYRLWSSQQNIMICNGQNGIGIRGIKATSADREFWGCSSDAKLKFWGRSSDAKLRINTSRGVQTLVPSTLGLRYVVADDCNLNHLIRGGSRGLIWVRCYETGNRNLQSIFPLENLRVLEVRGWFRKPCLRELWVAKCDAPLQLRELVIDRCKEFQRLPSSIGRLKQLKKMVLFEASCLRSLPEELGLLQSLEHLEIVECEELSSLPESMGNLRNLRILNLGSCTQLGRLPESINQLINLQFLQICFCNSVSEFDLGGGSSNSSLFKLKTMYLSHNSDLLKISIPKDCCPSLESLTIYGNKNLREIEGLQSSVIRLYIHKNSKLSALPSFSQLISRRDFNYRELEVPCVESVECMERLRTVQITAMRKSVDEGRIRSLRKVPGEIVVCMRAVENAASIVNSFEFPTLSLVDSCSEVVACMDDAAKLVVREKPSNGDAIIVCFVVSITFGVLLKINNYMEVWDVKVSEGIWVWIGAFTQRSPGYSSRWVATAKLDMFSRAPLMVEKGFIATIEEKRATEALQCILELIRM